MKKYPLFLFLCLLSGMAFGQELPPAYLITSDTIGHSIALPDSCWQMMTDPSDKMTFLKVLKSGQFQDTDRKMSYHIRTYWLRYRYINKMSKEAEIAVNASGTARTDLYIKLENDPWQHLKSGGEVSWSKRDGLKKTMFITLTIPAGKEITIYERDYFNYLINSPTPMEEGVNFSFTKNVIQQQYVDNTSFYDSIIQDGFLLGLMLLAIIINFYFFRIVHEKEFFYFTLFLLGLAVGEIVNLNSSSISVLPLLSTYISCIALIGYVFFFAQFIRHFLKTFNRFPRWDKYLIAISMLVILGALFAYFAIPIFKANLNRFFELSLALLATIYFVFILITLFICARGHDKTPKLLTLAILPFLCVELVGIVLQLLVIYYLKGGTLDAAPSWVSSLYKFSQLFSEIGLTIGMAWLIVIFSWVLFLRFSMLRKKLALQEVEKEKERNVLIAQQKIELEKQVTERTSELTQSLEDLKSTQKQLIQSEKMASLGELTAGIAHEIQNPLNFVNNFSEVNTELINELKAERLKPKAERSEQVEDEIINDIEGNSEKIIHHGKRADAIVKGMLQHSRVSTGQREPTNINALADEYFRLSYHGMRAKDKSFNVTMKSDFDESLSADKAGIGKINVVPQDIGRVLLNLFNNAFYAVSERSRTLRQAQGDRTDNRQPITENPYEPTVWLSTKKLDHSIEIRVKDNGNGIPEKIMDKIFQPFFTTKPTGEGTGLGLSLSYDMVKAHGGEITVNSKEGEGTEFMVRLPV